MLGECTQLFEFGRLQFSAYASPFNYSRVDRLHQPCCPLSGLLSAAWLVRKMDSERLPRQSLLKEPLLPGPSRIREEDPGKACGLTRENADANEEEGSECASYGKSPVNGNDKSQEMYTGDGSVDLYGQPSIRSRTGGWRTCPFILGTECCERIAFYGINTNLITYLTHILRQGNATAAKNVAVWAGTGYLTPIFGAFVADAYLGRYFTIGTFAVIYTMGLVLLTLSASLDSLRPPQCTVGAHTCPTATAKQLSFFYISLYLIAFGMGGIKPCVSSFGADQFDDEHFSERKKKTHFFNWFYLSINLGALVSTTVLVYIQDNISWAIGFGIPAGAMALSIFSFFLGTPLYRHQRPRGSPLTRVAQVIVAACRKWYVPVPADENLLFEVHDEGDAQGSRKLVYSTDFRFLDKAAVLDTNDGSLVGPWYLCSISQVEEVKQIMRIVPIWASTLFFSTIYAQLYSIFIVQGTRMDTGVGLGFKIPPASLSLFELITVIILVPIYDRIIVKVVRRFSGHQQGFTQLQRMGLGLFVSIFSMVAASLVEMRRLHIAKECGLLDDPYSFVPMTIFWQVPQFVLIGIAETFTYIGQLEFFYEQVPDTVRSLGTAMALTTYGLGYYMNSLLIVIVTRFTTGNGSPGWIPDNLNLGHIDYYFDMLAVVSALNLLWYLACAKTYKYKVLRT